MQSLARASCPLNTSAWLVCEYLRVQSAKAEPKEQRRTRLLVPIARDMVHINVALPAAEQAAHTTVPNGTGN